MDSIGKTKQAYTTIAEQYAETRSSERELIQFASFIKPGQRILDWGCGNGRLVHLLRDTDVRYVGIDQSEGMITVAKRNFAPEIAAGWVSFQVVPGLPPWPLENASFDLVFMIASLHHLPDAESRLAVLKEARRVLVSKGQLIITTWNLTSSWAEQEKNNWQNVDAHDFLIPWKTSSGTVLADRYYHHFEPEELRDLLVHAGFTVQEIYWSDGSGPSSRSDGKNLVARAS